MGWQSLLQRMHIALPPSYPTVGGPGAKRGSEESPGIECGEGSGSMYSTGGLLLEDRWVISISWALVRPNTSKNYVFLDPLRSSS